MSDYGFEAQEEMWDAIASQTTDSRLDQRQTKLLDSGICPYCRSARFTDDDETRTCEGCSATFPLTLKSA
jgi:hypothetical protein